jgi:prevent-host-death family protein
MYRMKTANITFLRAHLSKLLEVVRRGESIEILDRDVPIARLVPIDAATGAGKDGIPPWLEALRRSGVVRVGSMKGVPRILRERPPGPAHTGAVEALLEERRAGR